MTLVSSLTVERLRDLLSYSPDTGHFFWLRSKGRCRAGTQAGQTNSQGYRVIRIDGVQHQAHRLAWLYMTGAFPAAPEIDHVDGNKSNNRIANLREANQAQNQWNRPLASRGATGRRGVTQVAANGRFRARIQVHGEIISLGTFDTLEEAEAAFSDAALRYFGEFARVA